MLYKWQVAESSGNGLKNYFYIVLFGKKNDKTPFFKMARTILEIFIEWSTLPELCTYIYDISAFVNSTGFLAMEYSPPCKAVSNQYYRVIHNH